MPNRMFRFRDRISRYRSAFACALLAVAFGAGAPRAHAGDEEEAELLAVLKQETELATKTRMNSDFVPGIVAILEGDRMRALGARTVWDALPYVPGVLAVRDRTGTPSVDVRGVPFPFNSGSIQILLNGSPIWREAAGLNGSVLYMPMAQVERIEFIRGPGSVLYGDYAFMGLVNIVTRKQGSEVAAGVDSHGARDLSILSSGKVGGWETSLNLAGQDSDDAILPIGGNADDKRFSGVATAKYGGFTLQAQTFDRHVYNFATTGVSPARSETSWSGEARYAAELMPGLSGELRAQYLYNSITTNANGFKGDEVLSGADLRWTGWTRQTWLFGVAYSDANIDRATFQPPPPPGGGLPPPLQVVTDKHRSVASFYAQDQIELTDALRGTLGARYDNNSEIGDRVTPRAALVWQPSEHHVFKLQYAEGFRAPTFFELYAPGPQRNVLDFEVNRTEEFNYVYQRPQLTLRATLFRTRIPNMVFADIPHRRFANIADAKADGAEFELSQQISSELRIDANLSYVDARDNRDLPLLLPQQIAEVPHWMGNLGLLWNPSHDWVAGAHWNHVGNRPGTAPQSSDYDLVDLSLTRRALLRSLDLELGINNVFDKRVVQLDPGPFGDIKLPYQSRIYWTRLAYHW